MVEASKAGDVEQTRIVLGLLEYVGRGGEQSQRRLASELGVALGLANAYLKRCVKKGLVKVSQAPARRYAYYLTPRGFAEKSRLTLEFMSYSFALFRRAKADCVAVLKAARERGYTRIALIGASDLAEIAAICALDGGFVIAAVVDAGIATERFAGAQVVRNMDLLAPPPAWRRRSQSSARNAFSCPPCWACSRATHGGEHDRSGAALGCGAGASRCRDQGCAGATVSRAPRDAYCRLTAVVRDRAHRARAGARAAARLHLAPDRRAVQAGGLRHRLGVDQPAYEHPRVHVRLRQARGDPVRGIAVSAVCLVRVDHLAIFRARHDGGNQQRPGERSHHHQSLF